MNFWIAATAIPLIAGLFLAWPLINTGKRWLGYGVAVVVLVPLLTLVLYQDVGTPEGIGVIAGPHQGGPHQGVPAAASPTGQAGDMNQMLTQLRARLESNPNDLDGWLLLARSYKAVQDYAMAVEAMRRAQQLAPDEPTVKVELAEALIFTTQGQMTDEIRGLLSSALAANPDQPKGLWLSGMLAVQDGDDRLAITHWQRLMNGLEPGTPVAQSVGEQLQAAATRLGLPNTAGVGELAAAPVDEEEAIPDLGAPIRPAMNTPAPAPAPAAASPMGAAPTAVAGGGSWDGVTATVSAPGNLGPLPPTATLFVIARDPAAPNPPLGAMRVPNPVFPITVKLTDANSMMAQRPISGPANIEVSARLSLSGNVMPGGSDPRSAPAVINTKSQSTVELRLAAP